MLVKTSPPPPTLASSPPMPPPATSAPSASENKGRVQVGIEKPKLNQAEQVGIRHEVDQVGKVWSSEARQTPSPLMPPPLPEPLPPLTMVPSGVGRRLSSGPGGALSKRKGRDRKKRIFLLVSYSNRRK